MAEIALAPSLPGIERRLGGVVLALCMLALVVPALGQALGAPLAGWAANHGHVGRAALDAHHTHPYDHGAAGAGESDDGGFTFSNEGMAGAAVVPAQAPGELPASPAPYRSALPRDDEAVASAIVAVPTPPPRTPPV